MSTYTKELVVTIAAALLLVVSQRLSFAGSATWSTNPTSGDWATAANWTPNTVPDGAGDVATFGNSNVTDLTVYNTSVEVGNVVFEPGADPYSINIAVANILVTGTGIINNSGSIQTFLTPVTDNNDGNMFFFDQATAGEMTSFVGVGGGFSFLDSSSAGSASFEISNSGDFPGNLSFSDNSTAADATISVYHDAIAFFGDTTTAANAVITAITGGDVIFGTSSRAGEAALTLGGEGHAGFTQTATADHSHVTANGAASIGEPGATTNFYDDSSAGDATFIVNGATASGAPGAVMSIFGRANAANATITVNGGSEGGDGGVLAFAGTGLGGTASISLFGNGKLDIGDRAAPGVTIGSLAGDGRVFLGTRTLTIGSNNQSTSFSGVIQDSGSLTKTGTGTLTLSGANTYTGATTVSAGVLKALNRNGSATGTGAVNVNAGTLGGKGTITGPTTIGTGSGTGAVLQPGIGASRPTTLNLQGLLTFKSDSTYTYKLNTNKAKADQVVANGVTIQSGAQFSFNAVANKRLQIGQVFTAISNTSPASISGTFANLADGSVLTAGRNKFEVSYAGGDGNDLTLTVVP
jgi:autotransporter-associated beta strand protein